MEYWLSEQAARLRHLPSTKRYLYEKIDWSLKCAGILGARGTGKTTILLQRLADAHYGSDKALYISLDHPRFQMHDLYDFGRAFFDYGGRTLLLDEVHKYNNWSGHIKALYDACPDLQIIFSGSSILQMEKQDADLSRRAVLYSLHGLSFREYLLFELGRSFPVLGLADVLNAHFEHCQQINKFIKPLEHFKNYLQWGYYPFFLEGKDVYALKLGNVINHVMETDLPAAERIDVRHIARLKKLLSFLALGAPSPVNIQKIATITEISRPKVYDYLECLHRARMLNLVGGKLSGYKLLSKPEKIYLENSNLTFALVEKGNMGAIRETFFVNQLGNALTLGQTSAQRPIQTADHGDFVVNGNMTFEIGGKNKKMTQIRNMENAYIAADSLETGFGNKIPLWLFGFLY